MFYDRPFRDPSLHRLPSFKSETKVGIASRFERGKEIQPEQLSDSTQGAGRETGSHPSSSSTNQGATRNCEAPYMSQAEPKVMSKTEKTDVNLSRQGRSSKSSERSLGKYDNCCQRDGSVERQSGYQGNQSSCGEVNKFKDCPAGPKAKSSSPPVKRKDRVNLRERRRHTVGGTNDLENFKALCMVNQGTREGGSPEHRLSAWDRLQPAVKEMPIENRSLKSWIQQERLRTSSPAILCLFAQTTQAPPSEQLRRRRGTDSDITDNLNLLDSTCIDEVGSGGGGGGSTPFTFESSI